MGSPPPTRGTLTELNNTAKQFGITPAYAGNTVMQSSSFNSPQDHPRLRGEHIDAGGTYHETEGSPPPTRGTPLVHPSMFRRIGITPAYAGNTYICQHTELIIWDHPRLRGEHWIGLMRIIVLVGSPPPTRGTPMYHCRIDIPQGITPAYAGNTRIC